MDSDSGSSGQQLKERAVEQFMRQCSTEISGRSRERALQVFGRAMKKLEELEDEDVKRRWQGRAYDLECHISLMELFPRQPRPFEKQFMVYCQAELTPVAYMCQESLGRLIRRKVFVDEMNIPPLVEFDERDPYSFHGIVSIGDAPLTYSRMWIYNGEKARWGVLDRICTLAPYRQKKAAKYTLNQVIHFFTELSKRGNLGIRVLVVHVPLRPRLPLYEKLVQMGFKYVTSEEDKKKLVDMQAPLVYMENETTVRMNTVHMYLPLTNDPSHEEDLVEVRNAFQQQIARATQPDALQNAKRFLAQHKHFDPLTLSMHQR